VSVKGVFELPKATGALNLGAAVSWDNVAHNVVSPASGKFPLGVAVKAAGSSDTTVRVRLNGVATAAA
jgi:predicted RecA/RadA family phage recombinase